MGINYQAVLEKIKKRAPAMRSIERSADEARQQVEQILDKVIFDKAEITRKIDQARIEEKGLRCAQLSDELFGEQRAVTPLAWNGSIIAIDGSQIAPDKHQPELFGLINVGAITMRVNSGEATLPATHSLLLVDDDLYKEQGYMISDGTIDLMRDIEERTLTLDLATKETALGRPVTAWIDGPIELWGRRDGDERREFQRYLTKYLGVLSQLSELKVIFAGYVDKPSADPVTRMIEIAMADEDQLSQTRGYHPLRGVTDQWLFTRSDKLRLDPGNRSAIFSLRSRSDEDYTGQFALHFFYLNVSRDEKYPQIARVEIPKWVADDAASVDVLHAQILEQCKVMGVKPYPYLLHRAHETALVTNDDKRQLTDLIQKEIHARGFTVGALSSKQTAKDLSGRSKYGQGKW